MISIIQESQSSAINIRYNNKIIPFGQYLLNNFHSDEVETKEFEVHLKVIEDIEGGSNKSNIKSHMKKLTVRHLERSE